jgi:hypothetical protein
MKRSRWTVCLALALLSGCAGNRPGWMGGPSLARPEQYYARADLDEQLRFGAEMANKSAASRAEECRRLLKLQRTAPGAGVSLHLLAGRLLSDSCGDARKVASSVDQIPASELSDSRLQWWVSLQTEALKRMSSGSKRAVVAERRSRQGKDDASAKPDSAAPADSNDEAKVLRKKLEQIRALERKLDKAQESP